MDEIIGNRSTTQPDVIIDASLEGTYSMILSDEEDIGIREDNRSEKQTEDEEGNGEETKAVNVEEIANDNGENPVKKEIKQHKPRKRKQDMKLDKALKTVVNVITTAQKESDKMYMALEEKRMKLEEIFSTMEDSWLREDREREDNKEKKENSS